MKINKNYKIGIIGLGYVGLSLFQSIKKKNLPILGCDISKAKIKDIKSKFNYNDIISSNISLLASCNTYLICVPTPVLVNNKPDLSFLKNACNSLKKILKNGDLVIFESTVYPGVTRNICIPLLKNKNLNKNFYVGYSPERYSPGERIKIENITKLVSGENLIVGKEVKKFYSKFIKNVFLTNTIEEAEMAKNFENCQRDHNIALLNQLDILCDKTGINTKNIIEACNTKWNFNFYKPGLVGGHCISVDPYYLIDYAKAHKFNFSSLELSRNINDSYINFIRNKIQKFFTKKLLKSNDQILFIGGTYKKDIGDIRNSGALKIFKFFKKKYPKTILYDPLLKKNNIKNLDRFKAIIILVLHTQVKNNKKLISYLKNNNKVINISH